MIDFQIEITDPGTTNPWLFKTPLRNTIILVLDFHVEVCSYSSSASYCFKYFFYKIFINWFISVTVHIIKNLVRLRDIFHQQIPPMRSPSDYLVKISSYKSSPSYGFL